MQTRKSGNLIDFDYEKKPALEDEIRPSMFVQAACDLIAEFEIDDLGYIVEAKTQTWLARAIKASRLSGSEFVEMINLQLAADELTNRLNGDGFAMLSEGVLRHCDSDIKYKIPQNKYKDGIYPALRFNKHRNTASHVSFVDLERRLSTNIEVPFTLEEAKNHIATACVSIIIRGDADPLDSADTFKLATYALENGNLNSNDIIRMIPHIVKLVLEYAPDLADSRRKLYDLLKSEFPAHLAAADEGKKGAVTGEVISVIAEHAKFERSKDVADFVESIGFDNAVVRAVNKRATKICREPGVVEIAKLIPLVPVLHPRSFDGQGNNEQYVRQLVKFIAERPFDPRASVDVMKQELRDIGKSLGAVLTMRNLSIEQRAAIADEINTKIGLKSKLKPAERQEAIKGLIGEISKPKKLRRLDASVRDQIIDLVPLSLMPNLVKSEMVSPDEAIRILDRKTNLPKVRYGSRLGTLAGLADPQNRDVIRTLAAIQKVQASSAVVRH